jgi:hypothetical protein
MVLEIMSDIGKKYILSTVGSFECTQFSAAVGAFYRAIKEHKIEKLDPLPDIIACAFQSLVGKSIMTEESIMAELREEIQANAAPEEEVLVHHEEPAPEALVPHEEPLKTYETKYRFISTLSHQKAFMRDGPIETSLATTVLPLIAGLGCLFVRSRLHENSRFRNLFLIGGIIGSFVGITQGFSALYRGRNFVNWT